MSAKPKNFVKKDNVWKKPDYAAMLEEGIPLGVVYFIKKGKGRLKRLSSVLPHG